jgi:predicted metalloprotease with PDZ domain
MDFCPMRKYFIILLLSFVIEIGMAKTALHYTLNITAPQTHYASVQIEVTDAEKDSLTFSMPVWTPGSYFVREFGKSVENVRISVDGKPASFEHFSKNQWRVNQTKGKHVTFQYDVYAYEFSVRTSFIDASHAFLHNTSIFMQVEEHAELAGTLSITHPETWKKTSTTLPETRTNNYTFSNYDDLGDSPIEIGNHEEYEFTAYGVKHKIAMVGRNNCDIPKFLSDLKLTCETMSAIIQEHPCKDYLFIIQNVEAGGGGLEHANSCTVMMPRWNWSDPNKYKSLLGLCAHEYFHLWNVKRLRPIELGPFDYNAENFTSQLWVAEGITSYYDELSLLRMGLVTQQEFLNTLAGYMSDLANRPGVELQSLSESSHDAWIKEYRPNENSKNTTISYYAKGLVVAALLDIEICTATKGNKNLDDLMRYMYQEYYKKQQRGFTEAEFQAAAAIIAGKNLDTFFKNMVYTPGNIEYTAFFSNKIVPFSEKSVRVYSSGATTALENGKTLVKFLLRGSCFYNQGINVNDEIIAINGIRVQNNVEQLLEQQGNPKQIEVLVSRSGLVQSIPIAMESHPFKTTYGFPLQNISKDNSTVILEKWLGKLNK